MAEQSQAAGTEWVDIVNENNEVIAQSSRQQMRAQSLRHRATYIVVHDGMGKILVQRRTKIKDFYPGLLDATAGGVVQSGEQMLESARREAEEELGIAGVPFAEHGLFYYEGDKCRVWGGLFSCVTHGPFALQEEEVDEVSWLTPQEITARCDEFTPDSLKALSLWLTRYSDQEYGKPISRKLNEAVEVAATPAVNNKNSHDGNAHDENDSNVVAPSATDSQQ
ncbi:NUDIX hydrolase YfcD [Pectobacterium brasiliense]|uniref:NUDIX hydrolase YfcD n=1 Tax=Pectobacterium brasiliense TaxID=180957 RepID=A0AAE2WBR5_9GAMM|nr:NUDIX hydrolase YfcD [Pectobacterium brasiliense]MBA0217377.1 NUDIX hydrolase YfcD [Pectobacterium brasiliense]MBN3050385.1 NUDIX hydrolase YfcD [Pectobacterium brasiliense]MBN3071680.1 NUDIX hydrolase YfcD [Pectobacterium brasiliense]MBN3168537.1 NUDIX hydrolase YfcD [Pectobacterium brasiliense]